MTKICVYQGAIYQALLEAGWKRIDLVAGAYGGAWALMKAPE